MRESHFATRCSLVLPASLPQPQRALAAPLSILIDFSHAWLHFLDQQEPLFSWISSMRLSILADLQSSHPSSFYLKSADQESPEAPGSSEPRRFSADSQLLLQLLSARYPSKPGNTFHPKSVSSSPKPPLSLYPIQ